jgi:hypothetical protein
MQCIKDGRAGHVLGVPEHAAHVAKEPHAEAGLPFLGDRYKSHGRFPGELGPLAAKEICDR